MNYKSLLKPTHIAAGITIATIGLNPGVADDNALFQQHGSHVHGVATLLIAGEGSNLSASFSSPAINLAGFETATLSAEQQTVVDSVLQMLDDETTVLSLPAANCAVQQAHAQLHGANNHLYYHEHGHEQSREHSHEHGHDHSHPHSHSHSNGHSHSLDNNHIEFHAQYQWRCDDAESLSTLSVNIFSVFPGVETVDVQWVLGSRQGAATVSPGRHQIRL